MKISKFEKKRGGKGEDKLACTNTSCAAIRSIEMAFQMLPTRKDWHTKQRGFLI